MKLKKEKNKMSKEFARELQKEGITLDIDWITQVDKNVRRKRIPTARVQFDTRDGFNVNGAVASFAASLARTYNEFWHLDSPYDGTLAWPYKNEWRKWFTRSYEDDPTKPESLVYIRKDTWNPRNQLFLYTVVGIDQDTFGVVAREDFNDLSSASFLCSLLEIEETRLNLGE